MKKRIEFNREAREKLQIGVDKLANAVKVTLGPNGRNVIIGDMMGNSHVTKDGVTVAKHIFVEGSIENIGAQTVKQVAVKTVKDSGDGTTTSVVLAQEIIKLGLEAVNNGANPMDLKRGIDKATIKVVNKLKRISKPVRNSTDIKNVAAISANNDTSIGKVIAEAMTIVKNKGTISVSESDDDKTYIKQMDGYEFPQGFLTPYFINNSKRGTSVLENPYIVITDNNITNLRVFQDILTDIFQLQEKRDILFIVDSMEGEALGTLIQNHKSNRKGVNICVVKAPYIGSNRLESLIDIGVMTGGRVYSEKSASKVEDAKIEELGQCEKVIISGNQTVIVSGKGKENLIQDRVTELEEALESADDKRVKNFIKERIDRMNMSQAVIHIGASTPLEMEEKKDRYDDAICATRSAVEEGVVPGGGSTFIRCIDAIDNCDYYSNDERKGGEIIKEAILSPFKTILDNAGWDTSEERGLLFWKKTAYEDLLERIIDMNNTDYGFNAKTGVFEDLIISGVIDPTKVARNAIENAASIASLLITTECVIADETILDQQ